jgi:homoserine kinase
MHLELDVPATLSNLGPGFDCFGLSLDLANRIRARPAERRGLRFTGLWGDGLPVDGESLIWRSLDRCAERFGLEPPPLSIEVELHVPPGRGLGSSATAVAAGLALACAFGGHRPPAEELCSLGAWIEGHPDNVVPALRGGLCLCLEGGRHLRFEPPPDLAVVAVIPAAEVSTAEARAALPSSVPLRDAVENLSRASMLAASLVTGRLSSIRELDLMRDRLHQAVRSRHIPGFAEAVEAGLDAGALGVCISGSGPTVLGLCSNGAGCQAAVGAAIRAALEQAGARAEVRHLRPSSAGVLGQI